MNQNPADQVDKADRADQVDRADQADRADQVDPADQADLAALSAATEGTPDRLADLHARLARAARDADLLDVAYRTVDSPIGALLLASTRRGLVRVAFDSENHDQVLARLASTVGPRILRASDLLDEPARQLEEYFAGRRRSFDLPLDLALSGGFRRRVQRQLARIAYGDTQTYRQIAELVGSPKAARAVGTACATNPLPLILPCHRVLRSDGSLGGYAGGVDTKTVLLALEHAR